MEMENQILSEKYFSTSSSSSNNPYHYSKILAEKEAWRICEAQERRIMVTINTGMVLGPSLLPTLDSGSLFLLNEMLRGDLGSGCPI
jgi:dihydroflavonol-4-reductase